MKHRLGGVGRPARRGQQEPVPPDDQDPLVKRHRVLSQVSGHNTVVKPIPPLTSSDADCDRASDAFDQVIGDCQHVSGAVWDPGPQPGLARPQSARRCQRDGAGLNGPRFSAGVQGIDRR
jgi:hypothetical protein